MTHEELIKELSEHRNLGRDTELEIERLKTCYLYASSDDKKVIWAVLNKYVPMLASEGLV